MTITDIENESLIWIDPDGTIRFDSRLEKEFEGKLDLLIACVEDNINSDPQYGDTIYWYGVKRDYDIAVGHLIKGKL